MTNPLDEPTLPGINQNESATVHKPAANQESKAVGRYRLLEKVGEGGMGEVWEAEQLSPVRRRVAYKVIRRGMDSEEVVARFETERQAVALMDHPCIAKVFDAGVTARGRPFFVMEFVPGIPLDEHCDKHRLTTRERLELFIKVCEGVQHAHHKAIIHRDLKPSNVLVAVQDDEATPKIIDFGVAKATSQRLTEKAMHTEMGQLLGTPEYMSPEQAEMSHQNIDTRTDVYSLGIMLYSLLVGALPFDAKEFRQQSFDEIRRRIREDDPPRPSTQITRMGPASTEHATHCRTDIGALRNQLKGDLDWIVMKAIEKDRSRRYGSPTELGADIRRYLLDEPVLATPPSPLYKTRKFVRRHRYGVSAAATLLVLLISFAITMAVQAGRIAEQRDRANKEAETARLVSDVMEGLFTESDPTETRGATVTAREILDRGAVRIHKELNAQPQVQARLLAIMGRVYRSLGLYDQAQPLLEEALAIQEQDEDIDANELAKVLSGLGNLLRNTGSYAESEALIRRALEVRRTALGPEGPEVASSLSDLGILLLEKGDLDGARETLENSLAMREKALGANDPAIATSLNNLAIVARKSRDHEQALKMYRRALAILEKNYGADHPDLANVLNNMGVVQNSLGRTTQAQQSYQRSLTIRESVLGPEHPDVALTLNNMGNLMQRQGDLTAAEQLHRRALAIREATFGEYHPAVAQSAQNLAVVVGAQGDYPAARQLYERALLINESVLGERHAKVALTHYNLACITALEGDRDNALRHLELAVDMGFRNAAMAQDTDLASLVDDPRFQTMVAAAKP